MHVEFGVEADIYRNGSVFRFLCSNVRELVNKVSGIKSEGGAGDDAVIDLCSTLNEKLVAILKTIGRESVCASNVAAVSVLWSA